MRRELVNKNKRKNQPKQKPKQKSTEKPSIDSIDSSYAHMSSACEWKISFERDSGIGAETQSRRSMARIGHDSRGLVTKLN
jgi:hypothetical protein